jgi:phosphoglycerate dehydrogenase-like enzyme
MGYPVGMPLAVLVLADPTAPWLKLLAPPDPEVHLLFAGDAEQAKARAGEAEVILNGAFTSRLLDLTLPLARRARWIHSMWTGVERVLSAEVRASPLPLTNARGVFARPLAEWALGAMLHFSYDLRRVMRQQEAGTWQQYEPQELHGKVLGIVGYGGIGQAAAERARPFGMRILALRRHPERSKDDPRLDRTYGATELNDLAAASDYLLVAAPLTDETRGLIGEAQLSAMKPTSVVINVGRGPVIDESALVRALESGLIRGAALDVFDVEPLPAGHPFYRLQNVLLSPHTADRVQGFWIRPVECFLENLRRYRTGEPLLNLVDKQAGY